MRFFLDQHIDSAVARMLTAQGHGVWTAAEAGLSHAVDDDLTVYADNKRAALITHDKEFTARRRNNPIGQHIRLACAEWEAAQVLQAHLAVLIPILRSRNPVTIVVKNDSPPKCLERAKWR